MQTEQQVLISILEHFIHKTAPRLPEEINWDDVVYLAAINSVLGIVSYMIHKYQLEEEEEILEACKSCYEREYRLNRWKVKKLNELVSELQNADIAHVLFKGSVVRDYYPIPEFRSFSDIDILIRKEDRGKSRKLMKKLGFNESDAWEPVFTYKKDWEYYEIHTELLETDIPGKPGCRESFRNPWEHVVSRDDRSWQFTEEFHFRYLLTHLAKHLSGSGAGIRLYLDLALFAMRFGKTMDWEQVEEDLREMDLLEFAYTVMTAVKTWFGVDSPLAVTDRTEEFLEEFAESTLYGGTFGRDDKDPGMIRLSKEEVQSGKMNRVAILMKRLFPPAKQIEARYTYLQNRPWLLPVGWIHRFIITWSSHGRHQQELKAIFTADPEEARQWNEIRKKAGL